jgi:hypothetical protein
MQPYFFPYIGYFQLMQEADVFIFHDDVQYIKGGWVNRNRILKGGEPAWLTFPVTKDSHRLSINQRFYESSRKTVLHLQNQTLGAYSRAPAFNNVFPLLEEMFSCGERNVAEFNRVTLEALASLVGIKCLFKVSSRVPKADELRGRDRVIDLCRALGATTYINPIGGLELYKQRDFENYGIDLVFLKARITEYNQFGAPHVPFLSIIDVLMFNAGASLESIVRHGYDLVRQ